MGEEGARMDKKIVNILLAIGVLIMIAINILIFINNSQEKEITNIASENISQNNNYQMTNQEMQSKIDDRITNMPEKSRMQTYFGTFINYIEKRNYENAYKLLNEDFRNNYFKTIQDFENYFANYPKNIVVNYTDIDRQGELFVLTVEIKDMFDNTFNAITKRIVIREKGANDFTISFQVE